MVTGSPRVGVVLCSGLVVLALAACSAPGRIAPDSALGRGRAHLAAGRYAEARGAFREWLALHPDDPRAAVGLAVAHDELGALDSARAIYNRLVAVDDLPRGVRRTLEGRLRLLDRRELREAVAQAAAAEATLAQQAPEPRTVAVLPFLYLGADSTLQPLGLGLAHFFVSDLAQVPGIRLLERQRVSFLLDELRLGRTALVDRATAARSGRLLGAERVLQGSLNDFVGDRIRVDASLVATVTREVAASGAGEDALRQLFDLEKAVLFQLIDGMGITLTAIEEERLRERPTRHFFAFLGFSRGLDAEDRGEFRLAEAQYREAARLDPQFRQAQMRAEAVGAMAAAAVSAAELVGLAAGGAGADDGFVTDNLDVVTATGSLISDPGNPPVGRDHLAEIFPKSEQIVIVIPRPQVIGFLRW